MRQGLVLAHLQAQLLQEQPWYYHMMEVLLGRQMVLLNYEDQLLMVGQY
jgi:hypothetical protein